MVFKGGWSQPLPRKEKTRAEGRPVLKDAFKGLLRLCLALALFANTSVSTIRLEAPKGNDFASEVKETDIF